VNKLTLEVFSKLSRSIQIAQVELQTNVKSLNQKLDMMTRYEGGDDEGFKLSKSQKITIERNFIIDSELFHNTVWLNAVILQLYQTNGCKVELQLQPYLAPTDQDVRRLPPPVYYEIMPQPDQIEIKFVKGSPNILACVGDPQTVTIEAIPLNGINLTSLSIQLCEITYDEENSDD
jgi:hypothetical protein